MAWNSFGTLLKMGDGGGPEVFATLGEVLDIEGPELEMEIEDATNHSSTGGWEEKLPTILKAGTVSFEVNYLPENASHNYATGLLGKLAGRTKKNFQLVFPNTAATTWSFSAYVAKFKPGMPVRGKLIGSITLEITGQPTLV